MMRQPRFLKLALATVAALLAAVTLVWAFAEEDLEFRDPEGHLGSGNISTIHDDLTYALALAAGFSITDSHTLRIWNQLVDSELLTSTAPVSYTNCAGAFYPTPDPDEVCELEPPTHSIWPMWESMQDQDSCATSRFGPYSPFFHFPHQNAQDLGALYDWAWGITDTLVGYEAYAWGGPLEFTVMQASCRYTRTAVITTGMEAGSLEAFATYLHSQADSYSHRDCIATMDGISMPWATHTLTGYPTCNYNPNNMQADDVHGREFYTHTDALRTDEAIRHVYQELVARSLRREGQYFPISLDTPISGSQTLNDVLHTFVHEWGYDPPGPQNRRDLADQIAAAVLAQRAPMRRVYLPLVLR